MSLQIISKLISTVIHKSYAPFPFSQTQQYVKNACYQQPAN
ncbi:hypothetical protein X975_25414, partial [Stegodyphus mimosarum]